MLSGMDPMVANLPHVQAEWLVQADSLIAYARCPKCGADFGLAGEPELLASGDAKHWCRVCQTLLRVTATGTKPDVPPIQSQYLEEMRALSAQES